jgi:hypothetical protein
MTPIESWLLIVVVLVVLLAVWWLCASVIAIAFDVLRHDEPHLQARRRQLEKVMGRKPVIDFDERRREQLLKALASEQSNRGKRVS